MFTICVRLSFLLQQDLDAFLSAALFGIANNRMEMCVFSSILFHSRRFAPARRRHNECAPLDSAAAGRAKHRIGRHKGAAACSDIEIAESRLRRRLVRHADAGQPSVDAEHEGNGTAGHRRTATQQQQHGVGARSRRTGRDA